MNYVLNAAGDPVPEPDILAWARWIIEDDNRVVASDDVAGVVVVATVFLGTNLGLSDKPEFFETYVAGYSGRRRYATRPAAERGHRELVGALEARYFELMTSIAR